MKCVKLNSGKIERVSNEKADSFVKTGASYVSKTLWKQSLGIKKDEQKIEQQNQNVVNEKPSSTLKGKKHKQNKS